MRLIDANALCEFFRERYEYLRNASERQLPNGYVEVDLEIQCGAIIAKEFLDKANDAPTVDAVEVVHGRWIFKHNPITDPKRYFIRIVCSECNLHTGQKSNYCPSCGAKMDGDGND